MSTEQLKAQAMQHLMQGGKALGIGQKSTPMSTYDNPQLYPQIFPWLFPYGLGGVGNEHTVKGMSDKRRVRNLLLYHDKRFQLEPMFPLVAFNHQQVKSSALGGYLMAKQANFGRIADRLGKVNTPVLSDLIERLSKGERVKPSDDAERACFQVLNDLYFVAAGVPASKTSRKAMRSEIWSLVSYLGAPSWFITFAPSDVNHPIALYYAGHPSAVFPTFYEQDERVRLIANNPVAGAKFFKLMVDMFVKHVLGVGSKHAGLYGDTAGYYGTVEQ
ncbi:hypothetical protein FA95DRAFT_1472663, partial [Auriscalpium vulgare]